VRHDYAPETAQDVYGERDVRSAQDSSPSGTAKEVAETAADHARDVGAEVLDQGRHLVGQVKERLTGEAETQNDRLASGLRQLADDLSHMHNGQDSLAATIVEQISSGSRQAATYLEEHGPDGLVHEVQEFARRRPGTFLVGAAVAGFVAGRLGKGLLTSTPSNQGSRTTQAVIRREGTHSTAAGVVATGVAAAPVPPPDRSPAAAAPSGTPVGRTEPTEPVAPYHPRNEDLP
jgi:hypothetical protein